MGYIPGDSYTQEFCTQRFDTGNATNATGTPVATANKNGTDDGAFTLTVTNIDTGRYKVTGTVPAGYVAGDRVVITVAATVNGVAGKAVIDSFVMDSKRLAGIDTGSDSRVLISGDAHTSGVTVLDVTNPVLISSSFPRSQAFNGFGFLMVDLTDAPLAGLTVTAQRSIDGAAFAACANAVSEISAGCYKINLATTDLAGSAILLKFTATGAKTRVIEIITTPTS